MKSISVAVIGTGYWGKNLARVFSDLGALKVICDQDVTTLAKVSENCAGVESTASYDEVLADESISCVVLATPASDHFSMAKAALLSGKDVFVEKPLALSEDDGVELVELASKMGRILMVGHILAYHPAVTKLKELVDSGELGKIQYISSNRLNLGRFRTEESILWSFAPHDISAILFLLGEEPVHATAHSAAFLQQNISDVTITMLDFKSGVKGHIYVSWMHPYKEQKLVVVGDKKMALFDDTADHEAKLTIYPHSIDWIGRKPIPRKEHSQPVQIDVTEPLVAECKHFLECVADRKKPRTDGQEGLAVLNVLQSCERSLHRVEKLSLSVNKGKFPQTQYFAHSSAVIDESCQIGQGTKIWHYSHIMRNSCIGQNCVLGQNVHVAQNVSIGNNVKIQNNVSVYSGVTLEDGVFCGPSAVFTNVVNPRSEIDRKHEYKETLVKKGATIGANATIVCGHTIGQYSFIGAGAVVTKDVPDYAMVIGNPGRVAGWVCACGLKLDFEGLWGKCSSCGKEFEKTDSVVGLLQDPSKDIIVENPTS